MKRNIDMCSNRLCQKKSSNGGNPLNAYMITSWRLEKETRYLARCRSLLIHSTGTACRKKYQVPLSMQRFGRMT
jgi:hypothetical protein